jgi:hypothetical protein
MIPRDASSAEGDKVGAKLRMTFSPLLLLAGGHSLALPGALELGHYPRLVELRGRWRQARDHQPIHRVTLRFETIAGPGEPQRPFRRQRVIARHSTKPTWTQSLLRLGWCRERVRVPQEVTDAAVIEAGAAKRLQRVKTVRELSVVGPCITLGLVLRETGRRISYRDRQGKLKFISRQHWAVHTEPCTSCPDHPKTKYPDGYWD